MGLPGDRRPGRHFQANFEPLRQNLYRCAIINSLSLKVDGFVVRAAPPPVWGRPFFTHRFTKPISNHNLMNTTGQHSSTSITKAILLIIVIAAAACAPKEASQTSEAVAAPDKDIHTAVISDDTAALRQHIAAGSNINEKDPFGGSSPLISAAVFGKPAAARILIDAGADINFQNNDGSTALHTAAFFCRPEIVQMLLEKGADKTLRNNFKATAYDNVAGPFEDIKPAYDMMGTMLGPLGLTLDYAYLEQTRPVIADMLK
jgi:hypothetical protein